MIHFWAGACVFVSNSVISMDLGALFCNARNGLRGVRSGERLQAATFVTFLRLDS